MADAPDEETVVDLNGLAADDADLDGARAWSVETDDLGANLVVLQAGQALDGHVNHDADLFVVGLSGAGVVDIEDRSHELRAGTFVHVPKGTWRRVSGVERVAFLTVHRRVTRLRRRRRS